MGQKFIDYCSSNITPQMTLLEKFNKIIEYLKHAEDYNDLYLHTYKGTTSSQESFTIQFISNSKLGFDFVEINALFHEQLKSSLVLNLTIETEHNKGLVANTYWFENLVNPILSNGGVYFISTGGEITLFSGIKRSSITERTIEAL